MKKTLLHFLMVIFTTALHAQSVELYLKSAIDKQGSGDNEGAVADCNKALNIDPNNAVICNVRGLSKYNLGLYEEAIEDYSRTITSYPTNAIAYNYRGAAKYHLKKYKDAIKDFNEAIHLYSKYVSAFNNRGNAKLRTDDFGAAILDFNEAIAIAPDNAAAYNNRAYAKNKLGKFTEAIADCNKAISLDPKIAAGGYRNRGYAKISLGMYQEGIMDCNKAISLDLENAKAYNYRGYAYYKLGKFELAMQDDESVTEYEKDTDDTILFFDYSDQASAELKKLAPSAKKQILANVPATIQAENATTGIKPAEAAAAALVPKAIAPVESTAKLSLNFKWILPTADFDNLPDQVLKLTDGNEVPIKIKTVSNYQLDKDKFHLYVNGQDFSNGNKMSIADIEELKRKGTTNFNYTYQAKLNVGKDKSTIVLTYDKTFTSDTLTVMYTPTDISLHVLAIGTHAPLLKYPEKDAADFAEIFNSQKGEHRLFHDVSTEVVVGDDAKAQTIANKIQDWSQKKYSDRDVLMLFISSHGLTENDKLLLTGSDYKSTLKNFTTIDFKANVIDPLESVNCKKFIFIDACHSGAGVSGSKALEGDVATEISKMANSGNSITIICSSSSSEQSWEDETWGNGAFTKAIKEGLTELKADKDSNGFVTMDELYDYIKIRVAELVKVADKKDMDGKPVTQTPKMVNARGSVSIFQK